MLWPRVIFFVGIYMLLLFRPFNAGCFACKRQNWLAVDGSATRLMAEGARSTNELSSWTVLNDLKRSARSLAFG